MDFDDPCVDEKKRAKMLVEGEPEPEFVTCLRTIVQTDDRKKAKDMWCKLDEMENFELGSTSSMYNCSENYDKYLSSILTKSSVKNIHEIPSVLEWFTKFPFPILPNPISDDIALFMSKSAQEFEVSHSLKY